MTLRYLSLFSGIEAASEAWHPLGWTCVGVSEIEPFPCSLLAQRHPGIPNIGDVTKVTEQDITNLGRIDLIVFGSPCQDLSVAGKRKGLDGARSGLFFTAMRLVGWAREHCGLRFALWENVPGAFSSSEGRDFAAVVDELAGVVGTPVPPKGWGNEGCAIGEEAMVEWAVLDAQWFGVAQRRRRVFALADFGDWAGRPPILLEPQGMRGDFAPSRKAGQEVTCGASSGVGSNCGVVTEPRSVFVSNAEGAIGLPFLTVSNLSKTVNNQTPLVVLGTNAPCSFCGYPFDQSLLGAYGCPNCEGEGLGVPAVAIGTVVRRLIPRECERLQGFPDDHTLVLSRGKPAADGPRYKALGNSMAVPVMAWIGRQIDFAWRFF